MKQISESKKLRKCKECKEDVKYVGHLDYETDLCFWQCEGCKLVKIAHSYIWIEKSEI